MIITKRRAYHVTTQSLENYGAHADSGKYDDGCSSWKFKGGTDYIITGAKSEQQAVAFVAAIAMENNISWKEFPISWDEVDAHSFMTPDEEMQIECEGKVRYPAKRIDIAMYMADRRNKKNILNACAAA